jgi:hypothetical protein
MSAHKIVLGHCRGAADDGLFCAAGVDGFADAMEAFGLAPTEDVGVWGGQGRSPKRLTATLAIRSRRKYSRPKPAADGPSSDLACDLETVEVEHTELVEFALWPADERLEVYGTISQFERVAEFIQFGLQAGTQSSVLVGDLNTMVDRALEMLDRAALLSARVTELARTSYMIGPYAPKFLDTDHGREFLAEYAESASTAVIRFAGPSKRACLTLSGAGAVSFTCDADDVDEVTEQVRALYGVQDAIERCKKIGLTFKNGDGAAVDVATD